MLLDAAERLMLEEGYAAVTSRRVAQKAGLKPQLVHYYFRTMDDLFLELLRKRVEAGLERQAEALASAQPLRALWELSSETENTAVTMEFVALGNHRKAIRTELARAAERFRAAQIDALSNLGDRLGSSPDLYPPAVMSVLITSLSRTLVMEQALGMSTGHAETLALVERYLRRLEGPVDAP